MPIRSAEIIDLLPELRRYAGAVIGDRPRADELVEACLERVLADQREIAHLRLTLFATFDAVHRERVGAGHGYDATQAGIGGGAGSPRQRLQRALARLPLDARKALLLTRVARFSAVEAGAILGIPPTRVLERVRAAREELRRALCSRVLVLQSEPLFAMSLAHVIRDMGHQLCGVAQTRFQALARSSFRQPDLILADTRLRDGADGIATVQEIQRHRPVPAIVIADPTEPADPSALSGSLVIRKPVASHTLKAAVRRALSGDLF